MSETEKAGATSALNRRDLLKAAVAAPTAALVQASDGNFYSTTSNITDGNGTVFEITPAGTLTTLHIFNGRDGTDPYAGLVWSANGFLYGTTWGGGVYGQGTIFRLGPIRPCATCRRESGM